MKMVKDENRYSMANEHMKKSLKPIKSAHLAGCIKKLKLNADLGIIGMIMKNMKLSRRLMLKQTLWHLLQAPSAFTFFS